jgi:hypothetical protein
MHIHQGDWKRKPPRNRMADGFGPSEDETEKYD